MIYEIRMNVFFLITQMNSGDNKKTKTTLIDYIEADGVAEAFNKAAEYKHEVIIKIAKGESELFTRKAWDNRSDNISISLDAVVAKPEIEGPLPINIAGRYRTEHGMIPVPRCVVKECPDILKDERFYAIEVVTARKEGKFKALTELKRLEQITKETGISVATLMLMRRRGYKIEKV